MAIIVAISKVSDGNMLIKSDKTNPEVINNRKKFLGKNGIDINQATRINTIYEGSDYCRYEVVDSSQMGAGMIDGSVVTSDALVTKNINHALFLPIADCIGAVIYDSSKNILMLSHLGRHMLEQNGGYKSVKFLIDNFNVRPADLSVWLSPAPGLESYPLYKFNNRSLKDVAFKQLESAGILPNSITDNTADTSKDDNYFSHSEFLKGNRPSDGRFAIVAMMTD
ncbi:MAG: laccase domain-containing protein [Candidatus Saccharibacteria bacterium]|nr:laccase domain-containing protein [Candidatus Saccharibacteria bacterium]